MRSPRRLNAVHDRSAVVKAKRRAAPVDEENEMNPARISDDAHVSTVMKAALMRKRGEPFVIERLSLDEPRSHEVLVRIVATGVCHTDIAVQHRPNTPVPTVLGHEGAGIVERVGDAVRKVAPGDHVVLSFLPCGLCRFCLRGQPAYCEEFWKLNFACCRHDGSVSARACQDSDTVHNHFFGQSSFATYSLAHERNVVKVRKDAPLELLGPLGCGLQTGAGAVIHSLNVSFGDSFVAFGAGSVGLAAIMAARLVGATTIVAVDVVAGRLRLARELGATHVIDARRHDPVAAVRDATGGKGADYALDSTGLPSAFNQAIDSLGMKGAYGYLTGGIEGERRFDARAFLAQGKRIMAILAGDVVPDLFIPHLIDLHMQGRFPFDKLVKFYSLSQINRAFSDSRKGGTVKPIIRMT